MNRHTEVSESGPNIFADLGFPDADAHLLKAQIVAELWRLTKARSLTQGDAGKLMGITQPEISRLFKGHFRNYSVERLLKFLTAFDRDVEIRVRPATRRKGEVSFTTTRAAAPRTSAKRSGRR